jgi:hypothetical protein
MKAFSVSESYVNFMANSVVFTPSGEANVSKLQLYVTTSANACEVTRPPAKAKAEAVFLILDPLSDSRARLGADYKGGLRVISGHD